MTSQQHPSMEHHQQARRGRLAMAMSAIPEEASVRCINPLFCVAPELDTETEALMNQSRKANKLPQLQRISHLDVLAHRHALKMAQKGKCHHSVSSVAELQNNLRSKSVGENIHKGRTVADMHAEILKKKSANRTNMLYYKFDQMGTSTVRGEDGMLYSVQVFRGAADVF